jgi:hypothetical protein
MKLRVFVYRFAAILTTFLLGIGFFYAGQYLQSFFQKPETATVQPVLKQETLSAPPLAAPSPFTPKTYITPDETVADDAEQPTPEFSPDGDYYIIGDLPKGFKDFDLLTITTYGNASSENGSEGVPFPPEGHVWTKKKFDFDEIDINGKQISFETETKKGVSYKFAGRFIDEEEIIHKTANGDEYPEYVVLKGRLVKMRDGKKIAESKVKMGVFLGC